MDELEKFQLYRQMSNCEIVRHSCPECGMGWNVLMRYELGGWFYVGGDEQGLYPTGCGAELIVEAIDDNVF